jgi:hypothetical protein
MLGRYHVDIRSNKHNNDNESEKMRTPQTYKIVDKKGTAVIIKVMSNRKCTMICGVGETDIELDICRSLAAELLYVNLPFYNVSKIRPKNP